MGKKTDPSIVAAELRRLAEERLRAQSEPPPLPLSATETQRLVHELEVHQLELQMQNAQLQQTRDEMEAVLDRYTDLYDFAPVGYFTFDRNGVILSVNLGGAALLGMERARLTGRCFEGFVADGARIAFIDFLGTVFTRPDKVACELELKKEGPAPLFVQIEAVAAASGKECHAALIDISGRRVMEAKLATLHSALADHAVELTAANLELEAFNATVSHDLRRPLTAINGYCQVLQQLCGNSLDDACHGYLREIYEGSLRMNRLIDTMLDFSRVARSEIHRETVDLSKMAEEVASRLQTPDPGRRVSFRIAAGIVVDGDPGLLLAVLENLLGNAWKHTGQQEGVVIEFGVETIQGKPTCFVRDNGPGFDMALADKLFIPFVRLPGTKAEGYGIGLATVERIVRRHGGRVWAESAPGKGATFFFTLV